MQNNQDNIYPVFHKIIQREDKVRRLGQKARVIWFAGLSGAGKTTLAKRLEEELFARNFMVQILDGDNIRSGINNNLTFSDKDRLENIRRIAEVSKLFLNCGIIAINSFISPTREVRHLAMQIIGKENFIEVYINSPLEVCEKQDICCFDFFAYPILQKLTAISGKAHDLLKILVIAESFSLSLSSE